MMKLNCHINFWLYHGENWNGNKRFHRKEHTDLPFTISHPVCIQRILFMKYVGKGHICTHATKTRNVSYRASQSSGNKGVKRQERKREKNLEKKKKTLTTYMHMYQGLNPELIIHLTYKYFCKYSI